MDINYYLGIDGGGTSCRMRLVEHGGIVLGECQSGSANLCLGAEPVLGAIDTCMTGILSTAQLSYNDRGAIHVSAGMAGIETLEDIQWFYDYFADCASINLYADAHTACVGAFDGGDGALLIAGTGSIGWAIQGDNHFRIGGWGFDTSDLYSGAWLGHQAAIHANHAYDGLCDSPLSIAVLNHFDGDARNIVAWGETAKPVDYGKLAQHVINYAGDGDNLAQNIMQQAGHGISQMAQDLMDKSGTHRWCFVGGVSQAITPYLTPSIVEKRESPIGDALDGALKLAQL